MRGRHRPRALAAALTAALGVAALASAPQALAQTVGAIEGRVVDGTTDGPLEGIEVSLQLFSQQGDLGVLTTTSGRGGRFAFDELPDGVAGYQIAASYGGAEYRTVAQSFTPGQTRQETVTVYEPTTDPASVTVTDHIVWVDRISTGFAVQQDLSWSNSGNDAYIGEGDRVVSVPLPEGVENLQYLGTFLEIPGAVLDGAYVSDAPIVPGTTTATLRYEAPELSHLTVQIDFATDSFQLFVPQDMQARSPMLRLAGTISDQGLTYTVYQAQALAPGTTVEATLTQAPTGGGSSAIWILLAAVGLAVAVVLAAWLIGRRRSSKGRAPRDRGVRRPAVAVEPSRQIPVVEPTGNGQRAPSTDDDVDLIIDEIAALDISFEKGLLDEQKYKRLRVAAKDRLLEAERARAGRGRT